MKVEETRKAGPQKLLIKKCHMCGHIMESEEEVQKCHQCKKSFLPLNYFSKVHSKTGNEFSALFASCNEIHEQELIKGLTVIW